MFLELRVPGLSEPVTVIALAALRALTRAPEAKMMLLSPVIMFPIFGSMLWSRRQDVPESARPLIAIGAMGFVLLGVLRMMGNQFGFDRDGFRAYVLSATARRDILLGKNLAFAPAVLGIGAILLVAVQLTCPLRADHLVATLPQFLMMYLLFCIFANLVSILAPVYIAAGALKSSNPKLTTILLQLAMFLVLFPLSQAPVLLPLGIEAGLSILYSPTRIPICLILSLAEGLGVVLLYHFSLTWQGKVLQDREQKILEAVTKRTN